MFSVSLSRSLVFLGLSVLPFAASAAPDLVINGHEYQLTLIKNERISGAGEHYSATLDGQPGAWARLSKIDQRWVGLVNLAGEKFRVDMSESGASSVPARQAAVQTLALVGESVDSYIDGPGTDCASVDVSEGSNEHKRQSALHVPRVQAVQYSELCSNTVEGRCLLAELELVFDVDYQNVLGADAQATANSMINIVDGIYQNDLNVAFDVLTTEFLTSREFTSTTDASVLLDDIQAKKNTLPFVKNTRGLLHLVTGRNFNGGTAGIAFSGALCDSNGFGTGTSQLLVSGSSNDYVTLTSLIIAHELGHNFGAGHDGEDNTCSDGFIMEPTISSQNQSFSSCSVNEMRTEIEKLSASAVANCFNFPLSISISDAGNNPTDVDAGVDFTSNYSVDVITASRALAELVINGSVDPDNARFSSVNAGGTDCVVASGGASYQCQLSNPESSINLEIVAQGLTGEAVLTHSLQYDDSELIESQSIDNSVEQQVSINGSASPQPQPQPPVVADESGGGGAAGNAMLVMLLSALFLRFRGRHHAQR